MDWREMLAIIGASVLGGGLVTGFANYRKVTIDATKVQPEVQTIVTDLNLKLLKEIRVEMEQRDVDRERERKELQGEISECRELNNDNHRKIADLEVMVSRLLRENDTLRRQMGLNGGS